MCLSWTIKCSITLASLIRFIMSPVYIHHIVSCPRPILASECHKERTIKMMMMMMMMMVMVTIIKINPDPVQMELFFQKT